MTICVILLWRVVAGLRDFLNTGGCLEHFFFLRSLGSQTTALQRLLLPLSAQLCLRFRCLLACFSQGGEIVVSPLTTTLVETAA
jgi:hypothetical protein